MTVRQMIEEREKEWLSPLACLSANTKGREKPYTPCDLRTEFQRDRDRIVYSKAFRRLKHKTQVFIAPLGDHYRTRLTHTLEVAEIARTIARALRLNEDLTEAIALGHDLGHTPFGHAGERALAELSPGGFRHNEQSLRIVKDLEGGSGINLTYEVMEGILNHVGENMPSTLEGKVVRISDKIAFINHDIDDAERANILTEDMLPKASTDILGHSHGKRIDTIVRDVIANSKDDIMLGDEVGGAVRELEDFMFANVYIKSEAKKEETKVHGIVKALYEYFIERPELLSDEPGYGVVPPHVTVCDYISGMTDIFCIYKFNELFVPESWHKR